MLRLAIDTGGTFTDCVLQDGDTGRLWFAKALSTPDSPEQAVLAGVAALKAARPFELTDVSTLLLATTVATNAILERRGANVGLVTTRGFRDVVFLQRAKRYDTYDLHLDKPHPLVARRAVAEVDERLDANGAVLRQLDEGSVKEAIVQLEALDVETVAISLLHAYANDAHEKLLAALLEEQHPEWLVSCSSAVSPKYREYERTSTVLANAYVMPVVRRFLERIESSFYERGFRGELYVMQSNGGLSSPDFARSFPVNVVESGPAAGVLLGGVVERRSGLQQVLTFDMGGTTAKLGAVEWGEPTITPTFEVDGINLRQWSGLPLNISAVELIEIGAGGGSIAKAHTGIIQVGPESAGAAPGPACYGRGGSRPTITDANLMLGYLVPEWFAGAQLTLSREQASKAILADVAEPLGLDVMEAAWGIHTVANATMERAMRSMSIERGRDPRDFALVAFGGAGPLHACRLARALGIREVIVPYGAGVGSAVGMLEAEPRVQATVTRILPLEHEELDAFRAVFEELERRLNDLAGAQPLARFRRYLSVRYVGQGYELRIEAPDGAIDSGFLGAVGNRFLDAYRTSYGYAEGDKPLQATEWTLQAELGLTSNARSSLSAPVPSTENTDWAELTQSAFFPELSDLPLECPVYGRAMLPAGKNDEGVAGVSGPAIVADAEATTLVPPGDVVSLNDAGDLVIAVAAEEDIG